MTFVNLMVSSFALDMFLQFYLADVKLDSTFLPLI
jgi:hypothetical protein